GRRARGSPGARPDRTPRVGRVPAEAADDVGRVSGSVTHRMHVGNHFRAGITQRSPRVPGLLEKTKIFGTVDPRARPLPESRRRDQGVVAGLQPCQQPIGTLGLLGGAPDDAAHQEELRIVAAVQFGVYGLHTDTYSTDRAGLSRSVRRRESDVRN